jgi:hypothetical protein
MSEQTQARPTWLVGLATLLMAGSAVCFLKYAWWAACVSGWIGLSSYAEQLKVAHAHASFYLWCVIGLQVAAGSVVFRLIPLRYTELSQFLRYGTRLGASLLVTVSGTLVAAWLLSWIPNLHIR